MKNHNCDENEVIGWIGGSECRYCSICKGVSYVFTNDPLSQADTTKKPKFVTLPITPPQSGG